MKQKYNKKNDGDEELGRTKGGEKLNKTLSYRIKRTPQDTDDDKLRNIKSGTNDKIHFFDVKLIQNKTMISEE